MRGSAHATCWNSLDPLIFDGGALVCTECNVRWKDKSKDDQDQCSFCGKVGTCGLILHKLRFDGESVRVVFRE